MKKSCFILGLLLVTAFQLRGQYFLSGQDPASQKWMQLRSHNYRIIFAEGIEQQARLLAGMIRAVEPVMSADYGIPPKFTNLILHHQSAISNATSVWAPHRLDFHLTPPQDSYSQNWLKQLSIHEMRHFAQFRAMEKGFGKLIYALSGEQGNAAMMGIFVPLWFVEGDAVFAETVYSNSGRGRQALFTVKMKAQLAERGAFSYNKAYFGSYKDDVPNVYELGYLIVAYGAKQFGQPVWNAAIERAAKQPWRLNPFSSGIKSVSGLAKKELYQAAMQEVLAEDERGKPVHLQKTQSLAPIRRDVENYRSPRVLADGSILAIRRTYDDIPALVRIAGDREQVLLHPGILLHDWISARDTTMVWAEYEPDLRWSNRNFSVVKVMNLKTEKIKRIAKNRRLFSPALSPDNRYIAAVEQQLSGEMALILLDLNGNTKRLCFQSDGDALLTPCWHPDGQNVFFARIGQEGKGILKYNLQTNETEAVTPDIFTNFQLSEATDDGLLLYGDWTGTSSLYLLPYGSQQLLQLYQPRFGAADPVISSKGKQLVFSDYAVGGFRLKSLNIKPNSDLPEIQFTSKPVFALADSLLPESSFNFDKVKIIPDSSIVRPYRRLAHLFHLHSWSPVFIDVDNQSFAPGISLFSQNILSTMVASLGYRWDVMEQTGRFQTEMSYLGLYPEFRLNAGHGLRRGQAIVDSSLHNLKWKESDWAISATIPLQMSRGQWLRAFRPSLGFGQTYRKMEPGIDLEFREKMQNRIVVGFLAYNQHRMAHRDIFPRTGQMLQLIFRQSVASQEPASQLVVAGLFYLPGLMNHHGFRLYLGGQYNKTGLASFGNQIAAPRAYNGHFPEKQFVVKADYAFPIASPDWSISTLSYLKRLTGRLYFDFLNGYENNHELNYSAFGAEMHAEWNFFDFPFPVEIGFRLSVSSEKDAVLPELLFGLNFDTLY